jgi:hypothetical protein
VAKRFPYIVLAAAFSLAASAAYYSVFGLSKLFSSQANAVIILASTLEVSKLISASYLHRYWTQISIMMRVYLTTAVVVLMMITSLGIYGFLAASYQDTAYRLQNLETVVTNYETKKNRLQTQLNTTTKEKQAVDKNVTKLTNALANNQIQYTDRNGNQIIKTDASNRKAYEKQLDVSMNRLQELNKRESILSDSISAIELKITNLQTSSTVAAEVGPLKYVARITNKPMDTIVNWLIIMLILVFDPLAIILLISTNKILYNKEIIHQQDESSLPVERVEAIEESKAERVKAPTQASDKEILTTHTDKIVKETVIMPAPKTEILSYWNKTRNDREKNRKK